MSRSTRDTAEAARAAAREKIEAQEARREDHGRCGDAADLARRAGEVVAGTRPLRLSHSALEDWERCPRKWAWGYLGHFPSAPAPAALAGNAVHHAIEQEVAGWLRKLKADRANAAELPRGTLPLAALEDHARAYWTEMWPREDPAGDVTPEERWHLWRRVRGALAAYHAHVAPMMWPAAEPEHKFELAPTGHKLETAPWVFTGRVDALVERPAEGGPLYRAQQPDGRIVWQRFRPDWEDVQEAEERGLAWGGVDWKVSKPLKPGEEHQRPQATGYLLALHLERVRAGRPEQGGLAVPNMLPVRRFTFAVMSEPAGYADPAGVGEEEPAVPAMLRLHTTTRTKEQRAAYAGKLGIIATQMRTALTDQPNGELSPKPNFLCCWCGFQAQCAEGRAYMRERGLTSQVPGLRPADLARRAREHQPVA